MKKVLGFLAIFAVTLIAFYLEPVFFPPDLASSTEEPTEALNGNQSLGYQTIPAAGFSVYINQAQSSLTEVFGAPIATQDTGFGYSIATYNDPIREIFIEANIKNDQVIAIKVAGDSSDRIAPLHFGMDLTDLTGMTTLFSNFDFDFEGQAVSLELSEEDMNYRPLIAFDNDTFAMLFFGQQNNRLFAVAYLSKEMLLQVMPYQWNGSILSGYQVAEQSDEEWANTNLANSARGIAIINYLRGLEKLSNYSVAGQTHATATQLVNQLKSQSEVLLETTANNQWQAIEPQVPFMQQQLLYQNSFIDPSQFNADWLLAAKPVTDITFSILNWYSDPYLYNHFTETNQSLAIAFNQEDMVVLLQQENQTRVSDSSDN